MFPSNRESNGPKRRHDLHDSRQGGSNHRDDECAMQGKIRPKAAASRTAGTRHGLRAPQLSRRTDSHLIIDRRRRRQRSQAVDRLERLDRPWFGDVVYFISTGTRGDAVVRHESKG